MSKARLALKLIRVICVWAVVAAAIICAFNSDYMEAIGFLIICGIFAIVDELEKINESLRSE
jgi:hypothetical protein